LSKEFFNNLLVPMFTAQNTRGVINFTTSTPTLDHLYESMKDGRLAVASFLLRYVHEAILHITLKSGTNIYRNPLTPRQKEILLWVGEGLTSKAIADHLGMSFRTVEHHLAEIQRKLNVSNRQQAVTKAISLGFVLPINTPRDLNITLIF
jgi:DNA-binding CsgD family transcriptional regulator